MIIPPPFFLKQQHFSGACLPIAKPLFLALSDLPSIGEEGSHSKGVVFEVATWPCHDLKYLSLAAAWTGEGPNTRHIDLRTWCRMIETFFRILPKFLLQSIWSTFSLKPAS